MNNFDKKGVSLDEVMPLIRETLSMGQSVTFLPRGISMLPMLRQGRDSVTLSPLKGKLKKYDLPLYQRSDGKYVLHRIVRVKDTYTCIGDNQFVFEKGLSHDQMIAVVTSFTHNGKKYNVTDFSYKIYVRFWHYTRPFRRLWRGVWGRLKRLFKLGGN